MISLKTSSLATLFTVALVALSAQAAAQEAQQDFHRRISVTGEGEASGRPDQAEINAGVQTIAKTPVEASRENQDALARIMEALDDQGVVAEDIQTAGYSIRAVKDYEQPGQERITGYEVSNVVSITLKDIAKVGEVLAAVTGAGANSVNGIAFRVADTDALEAKAREAAMADARATAESLAQLAGVEVGEVMTISANATPHYPRPMMAKRAAFEMAASAPVPDISPGQQSVRVTVNVSYAIR